MNKNTISKIDQKVIKDFGNEWDNFDQSTIEDKDLFKAFNQYFEIFPKNILNKNNEGFDMGCGSGRWSKLISPLVKKLNCLDPSLKALNVAKKNLANHQNVNFYNKGVNETHLKPDSQNFGYCLGVLHHITDTQMGIRSCYNLLKKNSPFLIYLYYRFDNKPFWFKIIWKISDFLRKFISRLPFKIKKTITFLIAISIYYPFSRISKIFERLGFDVNNFPLSYYRNKNFYFMATDSLDRFGTKLEKRFTKKEIEKMLLDAGFVDIKFSKNAPYWVALAWKK